VKRITSTGTEYDMPFAGIAVVGLLVGSLLCLCLLFSMPELTAAAVAFGGLAVVTVLVGARVLRRCMRERTLRIEIDPEAQTVTFYNFVFARDFWRNPPIPHVRCQFGDIHKASFIRTGGGSLVVRTVRGVVVVPSTMSGFRELLGAFMTITRGQASLRVPLHCRLWFWYALTAATALLAWLVGELVSRAY
jgi:hypothetical protein